MQERIAGRAAGNEIVGNAVEHAVWRNAISFPAVPGQVPQAGEALDEHENQSNPRDDLVFCGEGPDEREDRTDRVSHAAGHATLAHRSSLPSDSLIGAGAMRLIAFGRRIAKSA